MLAKRFDVKCTVLAAKLRLDPPPPSQQVWEVQDLGPTLSPVAASDATEQGMFRRIDQLRTGPWLWRRFASALLLVEDQEEVVVL